MDDVSLARTIELRRYNDFRLLVGQALKNSSWALLLDQVKRIAQHPESLSGWDVPLRTGVIRDALIDVLDLKKFNGIDGDLLDIFRSLDADNIHDLREQALTVGIESAKSQIRKGNTFFFDIEQLADNSHAVLVPDILERRKKQIEHINSDSSFGEIYSTYYGFTILTRGGVKEDSGGATSESLQELESVLGAVVNGRRQIRYSSSLFGRVTPYTRKLLWGLLRISLGGRHSQIDAARELGELGDSRAVDLMHHRLYQSKDRYISNAIIEAIGSIGSPDSFEILCSQIEGKKNPNYNILASIGGIRHPDTFDYLADKYSKMSWGQYEYIIKAMAQTRDSQFVPLLVEIISKRGKYYIQIPVEALKAIKMIGDYTEVLRHAEEVLNTEGLMHEVISLLDSIPDMVWTDSMVKVIVTGLTSDHSRKVAKAVKQVPALLENPAIKVMLS